MVRIAVASGKGGVGKSMLTSLLCHFLAKDKQVVAVDGDVDAPNLHLWLGQSEDWDETVPLAASARAVVDLEKCTGCGQCVDLCAFGALSLQSGQPVVNQFLCEGCGTCEVVCPAQAVRLKPVVNAQLRVKQDAGGFPLVAAQLYPGETGSGKIVDRLKEKAAALRGEVLVIDAPAGLGCPVIAALRGIDYALLVTEPTPSGLTDLKRVGTVVDYFQLPHGVVVNKYDLNLDLSQKIKQWTHQKGGQFLGQLSYDQKIFSAISSLQPLWTTDLPVNQEVLPIFQTLIRRLFQES